ncbi:MAG: glycosyltransferase [Prevotella sp.]|nr:glycosyltransferase [Prevotella sp.]
MIYKHKLSIIVPVYNVEAYLERCVRSLLDQDIDSSDYEIILVNDGSTDGSGVIARNWEQKSSVIELVEQENQGASVARNRGLEEAEGQYIMFVDADDFIEPNVIGHLVSLAERNDLDLLFYDSCFYPFESRQTARQPFELDKIYSGEYAVTHGLFFGAVWSNLYSHKFLNNTGVKFLEGILHQDVDFNCRVYPQAKRIMFSDLMVYDYFVENVSSTRMISFEKQKKSLMDDLVVVSHVKEYANAYFKTAKVRKVIDRKMNSTLIGNLIALGRNKGFDFEFVKTYIVIAKQKQVYPIKGRSLSSFTTLLIPLMNLKWLYFAYAQIHRFIK